MARRLTNQLQLMDRPEFWFVKVGNTMRIDPGEGRMIHLSLATLESENATENVTIYVTNAGKKLVLGTITSQSQINFNLFFEREFELSHNGNRGIIVFSGYVGYRIRTAREKAEDKWGAVNITQTEEDVETMFLTKLDHLQHLVIELDLETEIWHNARAAIESLIHEVALEKKKRNVMVILKKEISDIIDSLNGYQLYYAETEEHIQLITGNLFDRITKVASTVIGEDAREDIRLYGTKMNLKMLI